MKYFACFKKMDEHDGNIYNIRYSKRVNVGINVMKDDNEISLREFKLNPLNIIVVLDIPDEQITLYKMLNDGYHRTFKQDTNYSEIIVPFIKKEHVEKIITLPEESYRLITGTGFDLKYLTEQYPVIKTLDNYLNTHCIDWYSCKHYDLAPLYDFLMCIDNIPETTEFNKIVKIKLRQRIGRITIKIEDALEDDDEWYDSDVADELDKLKNISGILDYLRDELSDAEAKRALKIC
jgi:hypothetical protein